MLTKQTFAFSLIVVLPLALVAWFGLRLAQHEQAVLREQFRALAAEQLQEVDRFIAAYIQRQRRELLRITNVEDVAPKTLRAVVRHEPLVRQLFVLTSDGLIIYPHPDDQLNQREREFLARTEQLIGDRDLVGSATSSEDVTTRPGTGGPANKTGTFQRKLPFRASPSAESKRILPQIQASSDDTHGWHLWYWGRGLNLIFWRRDSDNRLICVELDRARWIADLIGELPDTGVDKSSNRSNQVRLVNSSGNTLYQWGNFEPAEDQQPFTELALTPPLSAWRLNYFLSDESLTLDSTRFNIISAVAVISLAICGLAVYFFREYTRDMREAEQRVSFVNQVSHELKTPLTNIRMYADLLEADLDLITGEEIESPKRRLNVIQQESQRLSRLIGNVLTFAKRSRNTLQLRPRPGCIDDIIKRVRAQFAPSLNERGIEVVLDQHAPGHVNVDADALEQILGNLVGNVEKYAANGKLLRISSRGSADRTVIEVEDDGPGIPRRQRDRIFQPFQRSTERLEDTAGTGIGLTIARQLARLHGGELELVEGGGGAKFRLELATPATKEGASE